MTVPYTVLTCPTLDTQLSGWPEKTLAILGILTLIGAIYSWCERRQTVNLQVARRARQAQRSLDAWIRDPSLDPTVSERVSIWVNRVSAGENEVEQLLEEMLDAAGGASPKVQRETRRAYGSFLKGADLINKYSQPESTGHVTTMAQAVDAKKYFEEALRHVSGIVAKDFQ